MVYKQLDYQSSGAPWTTSVVNQFIVNDDFLYGSGLTADHLYNSGFFAVTHSTTYTKAHGLGSHPRFVLLQWCSTDTPGASTKIYDVALVKLAGAEQYRNPVSFDQTNVYITTGTDTSGGVIAAADGTFSATGYYRVLAWLGKRKV